MKLRMFGIVACFVAGCALLVVGCKSKETTSAMIHNDTGRHDLAIEQANIALQKNPDDAEAYFQLGVAYSKLDSVQLAYKTFTKAGQLDPKRQEMVDNNIQSNFARHYNFALTYIKDPAAPLDELKQAAMEFKLATQADPAQEKGYYQLGKTYARMGDADPKYYALAIPPLDKVLELSTPADANYVEALSLAGQVLAKTGNPEEAQSRFSRLVEEDPTSYHVIERIGMDLLTAEDWRGAVVFLELAMEARSKIGAEDFALYYNLGVAYFQYGKDLKDQDALAQAVDYYEKGLMLQPDEPQTTHNIVVAYVVGQNWQQAAIWGEKYVSIEPEEIKGWVLLSRSYSELGNKEKARQCTARAEQLRQKSESN